MEEQKVQKFISISGIASRKNAENLIKNNEVTVNDKIVKLGDKCLPTDIIKVNGEKINFNFEDKIYIILNKKIGYSTSNSENYGQKTIFHTLSLKDNKEDLFTINRLERHTTGLVILTNDKGLSQKMRDLSSNVFYEYIVGLNRTLSDFDKLKIESGVKLKEFKFKPCKISSLGNRYIVKMIPEKQKELIKIFNSFNYDIESLEMFKIGSLNLNELNLNPGEYKIVSKKFLMNKIFGE